MLATLIQRYHKKSFNFLSISKPRDKLQFYRLSDVTFYDYVNIFSPFLGNKMSISEEYGAFENGSTQKIIYLLIIIIVIIIIIIIIIIIMIKQHFASVNILTTDANMNL